MSDIDGHFDRNAGRRRRPRGRALLAVLLVVSGAVVGIGGGYWLSKRASTSGVAAGPAEADEEQWYTCGMHPDYVQKGPGNCPICGMKLTPRKAEDEGEGAAGGPKERKILYWRAPMDPNYISDKPGKSPMGMDLVPVYADADESPSAHTIRIDPVTIQNMGIRTAVIKRGPLVKTIRTVGRIDYDEQLVAFINTKFEGWIEKLYVDETGQRVEKGQPLFDVYSPELYSAQEEYLAALRGLDTLAASTEVVKEQARRLLDAARIKLEFLDVSKEQIDALRQTGEIQKSLVIHSPSTGIVTEKMAQEGMYVKPGMKLYTIADLSRVWVYVDIYEYQLPWVRIGQTAVMTLPYVPGREFVGQVVYIYPYLEERTRVIKVRLEFDNPTLELKPEMYANIVLQAQLGQDALLIPREAYIDSGKRQLAFIDLGNGKFQPREIQVGVEAENGMVEVLAGLDEGEVVVVSGQFMLDAESKLKEAVAKMMEAERAKTTRRSPTSAPSATPEHGHAAMYDGRPGTSMPTDAAYACPMEEHPDESDPAKRGPYFSSEPGECPLCGMKLKPVEDLPWAQARLAAEGGDVAYTCPDHQTVFSTTSGECPRCGRELEPFKAMYTCPDPQHAGVISTFAGNCPRCGRGLAVFRGIWLDEAMADANVPPHPGLAEVAAYRCPTHPLVHSGEPGLCTICGQPLQATRVAEAGPTTRPIPADAKYACPMQECGVFSPVEGKCPKCGMRLKPIDQVAWARELPRETPAAAKEARYLCPMHPDQVQSDKPGTCPICGMQLVHAEALPRPQTAPARIAAQMDYITEHYLELQRLLASDRTTGIALNALGLASASEELAKQLGEPGVDLLPEVAEAVDKLRAAALKTTGTSIEADRVTFVELSAAMRSLLEHLRPDKKRWPTLYIYHCPMSKGDWVQATDDVANPYYGFKMLKCGVLRETE